ncbi:asparagine synthase-related protein [Micromonospora endophytica]|uniref:Asparagine synthetase domain-containing protein n=1 Tax=Micromonospora endophytica TaxID=515350 RepID=A0A2W2BM28_9ACTN|nr:asparagine synthase-related protein [Micromonospora endophytica]PZF87082.1 hypothetical protein C1I93_26780 [Micromonospora endophytica]RIW41646.1 hypothetical protein D3H59_25445 [Micromonospora endophytica]
MFRPTASDIATGLITGIHARSAPTPTTPDRPDPLTALERAVLPALQRQPCAVSFSGGLDSSLVLAVAARVARRVGLPDPVPVTWRFTDAPGAEESTRQDQVIRALGLRSQWQILRAHDDLDLVGPIATRLLHRHGVLYPANLHLHLPILDLAAEGSLLTGFGGDQVLSGWRPPLPRRLRSGVARFRRAVGMARRQQVSTTLNWLQPPVARHLRRELHALRRSEPFRLGDRIDWHLRRREVRISRDAFAAVAADHRVALTQPLLDAGFLQALTAHCGHRRNATRFDLLAEIARDALPTVVTAPRGKARFNEVFLREPTMRFIRQWPGTDVDPDIIDVPALRSLWSRGAVVPRQSLLIQQLWLAANPPPVPSVPAGSTTTPDRGVTS